MELDKMDTHAEKEVRKSVLKQGQIDAAKEIVKQIPPEERKALVEEYRRSLIYGSRRFF